MSGYGLLRVFAATAVVLGVAGGAHALTLKEAVQRTLSTNPEIGAAIANRNATDYGLRQARGRLLPSLDLQADTGSQKIIRPSTLTPDINDHWLNRQTTGLTARQVLFHGWDRANDIYKNAARVDAAALRILERSQALALDAVEAYIDVRRHYQILSVARENIRRHKEILRLVKMRKEGGKAPVSEVDQTLERLAAAEAIIAQVEQALLETKAKFRKVVGLEPVATSPVAYPRGINLNRQIAIDTGIANNPAVRAADADADVARFTFKQSKSGYFPQISLEGTASWAEDIDGTKGRNDELVGKVVLSWRLFEGLIKVNRRRELAERWTQAQLQRDVKVREIIEVIDRAIAAYTSGQARVKAVEDQVAANRKVVKTYFEEYELSKRSLLDLLDSETASFNSRFQLASVKALHLFSAYQLLAGTGQLLAALDIEPPPEAISEERLRRVPRLGRRHLYIEPLRK